MIELRAAVETDLAQLTVLWQEHRLILSQVDQRFRLTAGDDVRWMNMVRDKIKDPHSYFGVAVAGSSVVGYVLGTVTQLPHTQAGVIEALVLDAHRYYGGLGRRLVVALRTWFEEQAVETLFVHVPRLMVVEQAFWRSLGAVEVADGMDVSWLMTPEMMWMQWTKS